MKKRPNRKNPVARVLNRVNRPQTHRDQTKYRRKGKHPKSNDLDISH